MANSYTLLADLKAGRCSNTAEVRLLRFWEARNTKKGGELMSIDMLFLDEQVIPTLTHLEFQYIFISDYAITSRFMFLQIIFSTRFICSATSYCFMFFFP